MRGRRHRDRPSGTVARPAGIDMPQEPADPAVDHAQYVTLDELQPSVDLAACYDFHQDQRYQYRVPGAHFLLVAEGRIDGRSPSLGEAEARTGEMLCFPFADL